MDKSIVIIGAGNIGRSFIGPVFSAAAYHVVFVDVNASLVNALNAAKAYDVVIREPEEQDRVITVSPVSAVQSGDISGFCGAIGKADIIATSVGQAALAFVFPLLARALHKREKPVDIIIAENIHGGASFFREGLGKNGLTDAEVAGIGLVETSIGKMVPLARKEDLIEDPLRIVAEKYKTLIVDKNGFVNPVPVIPDLMPVEPIGAWVDRKLYIHNLGHSAVAYLGFLHHPGCEFIWEILEDQKIEETVTSAMTEAAVALALEYPDVFTEDSLTRYITDLISRFKNRKLGDTVYRVGRDLTRKLAPSDRLQGALALARKHMVSTTAIEEVIAAALRFRKKDTEGNAFARDIGFHEVMEIAGTLHKQGLEPY